MSLNRHITLSVVLMRFVLLCLVTVSFARSHVGGEKACIVCTWDMLEGQRWHVRSHMAGPCAADAFQESACDSCLNQQMLPQGSQQMQQRMEHNLPSSPPLEVSASTT